jgi:hypothetical protein
MSRDKRWIVPPGLAVHILPRWYDVTISEH